MISWSQMFDRCFSRARSEVPWAETMIRSLTMLAVPVLLTIVHFTIDHLGYALDAFFTSSDGLGGIWMLIGLIFLTHAALRVPGKRAPWDRWSGTMVRYRTTRTPTLSAITR